MAVTIPMLVGGIAAYVQKKTDKTYFFEQTAGGLAGYSIGLMRVLAADNTYITNRSAAAVLVVPAFISGMGWGVGRAAGGMLGEAAK